MAVRSHLIATTAIAALVAFAAQGPGLAADNAPLLRGHIVSTEGAPLAGIPVKARLANSNMTVAVYTDKNGDYDFPSWSDVKAGSWTVGVELPDFEHVSQPSSLAGGKTA